MKTKFPPPRVAQRVPWCLLLSGWLALSNLGAPTLSDFGYKRLDPGSSRPLLVILGDFDCYPQRRITRDVNYYQRLFFDRNTYPSLNGFLWENSLGRFQVTPAGPGVIGPLVLNTNESFAFVASKFPADAEKLYYSNVVRRAMISQLVDFGSFDKNGNKRVEPAELSLTFMNNEGGGASRSCPVVQPPGFAFSVGGCSASGVFPNNCYITANFAQGDFESMAHEQLHQLGLLDLYGRLGMGCPNGNLSTMTCTVPGDLYGQPNNSNAWYHTYTWNLDPWDRMLFGWCEPRLVSIEQGGRFSIPAAQLHRPDSPILLYDPNPARTTNDYFLLEYRTPTTQSGGQGYDVNIDGAGLVIWHFHPDDPQWHVPFVYTEGPPSLVAGERLPWPSESLTPYLQWRPNALSAARIYVHPFNPGDDSIDIEILVNKETYVDFNSTSQPETGSFQWPYNQLNEGLAAASWGGTLFLKGGGHTTETAHINKATKIKTYGSGSVTLGR
jgi:M6 family metalloprotease-like protein